MNPLADGAYTALVTPFDGSGHVDTGRLCQLANRQIDSGIVGLALCGATGEESTLLPEERTQIVSVVRRHLTAPVPIIGGASSNVTRDAIDLSKRVADAGADAVLSVVPYYNKPNQSGILAHFTAIADASPVPVVLSNVPGRTGCAIDISSVLELAGHPNIAGIDEGSGDLEFVMEILRDAPAGFKVFSGEDSLSLAMVLMGAAGSFSLVSNLIPDRISRMIELGLAGDVGAAKKIQLDVLELCQLTYIDTNPIPAKALLADLGLIENNLRLPLTPLAEEKLVVLKTAFEKLDQA